MMDPRPDDGFGSINDLINFKHFLTQRKGVKVIHRVNDSDIARGTNFLVQLNIKANELIADKTVFISSWLKDHYIERGFKNVQHSYVITNGCNKDWYFPLEKPRPVSSPIKLVTHHWSDNYNKGFDAYIAIDKWLESHNDFEFTYVGRYCKDYAPKFTKIIPPMYGMDLGNELRKHDIYVTAARWEACGMHHIEGAACGLPIVYHVDGGGVVEICKKHGVAFKNTDELIPAIESAATNINALRSSIDHIELDSTKVYERYLNVMTL